MVPRDPRHAARWSISPSKPIAPLAMDTAGTYGARAVSASQLDRARPPPAPSHPSGGSAVRPPPPRFVARARGRYHRAHMPTRLRSRSPRTRAIAATPAAALALASTLSAACTLRHAPVEAPVEVVAPGAKAATAPAPKEEPTSSSCVAQLSLIGRIDKSAPGCFLDERISSTTGLLHYPCSGDGLVDAEFGEHRYKGRLTAGALELELTTELDWDDGCRWGTRAVINGTLASNGALLFQPLAWHYRDRVLEGTRCSRTCTARAALEVTSSTAQPTHGTPADPDGDTD